MRRFPLLILVWALRLGSSLGCDTGVAYPGQALSLYRSSLANADVALLRSYGAADLNSCLNDCCTEKYGSCSVASFKKNATGDKNCDLFNCRPVQKCKFASSSTTDSFSFSSDSLPKVSVPSSPPPPRQASGDSNSSSSTTTTTTTTTTSTLAATDEPVAPKNDNTLVKPRKGVIEGLKDIFGNEESSGVKPRKGVSLEGVGGVTSKVKPRKGVGPQPLASPVGLDLSVTPTASVKNESKVYQDVLADDLVSALEKVFEDDVKDKPSVTSSKDWVVDHSLMKTSEPGIRPSASVRYLDVIPTSLTTLQQATASPKMTAVRMSSSLEVTTSGLLLPSLATSRVATSSVRSTPYLQTTGVAATSVVFEGTTTPSPTNPTILEHSRLIFHEVSGELDPEESESERKYKSSMHLVLSLVFGLVILVSVLGVVAKRVYDSWMRRHYRRMDFLIDGMYNGYG